MRNGLKNVLKTQLRFCTMENIIVQNLNPVFGAGFLRSLKQCLKQVFGPAALWARRVVTFGPAGLWARRVVTFFEARVVISIFFRQFFIPNKINIFSRSEQEGSTSAPGRGCCLGCIWKAMVSTTPSARSRRDLQNVPEDLCLKLRK